MLGGSDNRVVALEGFKEGKGSGIDEVGLHMRTGTDEKNLLRHIVELMCIPSQR